MSKELNNLVRTGKLKLEPARPTEFEDIMRSARARLTDAQNQSIGRESQFDLAYGAAHRLASAALRRQGYRCEDPITVSQTIMLTVGTDKAALQIFLRAYNQCNLAEYEGSAEIDERLLADLIRCTRTLEAAVAKRETPH